MKFAVYTIALNEAANAKRWARSAADADYRVVADTGSTDDTVERLSKSGVTVNRIAVRPWCSDVARSAEMALLSTNVDVCSAWIWIAFSHPICAPGSKRRDARDKRPARTASRRHAAPEATSTIRSWGFRLFDLDAISAWHLNTMDCAVEWGGKVPPTSISATNASRTISIISLEGVINPVRLLR